MTCSCGTPAADLPLYLRTREQVWHDTAGYAHTSFEDYWLRRCSWCGDTFRADVAPSPARGSVGVGATVPVRVSPHSLSDGCGMAALPSLPASAGSAIPEVGS